MKDIVLLIVGKLHAVTLNVLIGLMLPLIVIFALSKKWVFELFGKKVSINE
jgi:hypothetical protein